VDVRSTFRLGRWPLRLPIGEVQIRDSEKNVSFRALALGLPNREVLRRDSRSTFRLEH
jgi:hypothetical protein